MNEYSSFTTSANRILLDLTSGGAPNTMRFIHVGNSTTASVQSNSHGSPATFFHVAMTWDVAADELKAYLSGSQFGATQSSLGTPDATVLDSAKARIASDQSGNELNARMAHWAVWTKALTGAEVLSLATV